jgi:hypothetical protein
MQTLDVARYISDTDFIGRKPGNLTAVAEESVPDLASSLCLQLCSGDEALVLHRSVGAERRLPVKLIARKWSANRYPSTRQQFAVVD